MKLTARKSLHCMCIGRTHLAEASFRAWLHPRIKLEPRELQIHGPLPELWTGATAPESRLSGRSGQGSGPA